MTLYIKIYKEERENLVGRSNGTIAEGERKQIFYLEGVIQNDELRKKLIDYKR